MPFDFTPKQGEANRMLAGPQRRSCGVGGARSGKTTLFVRALMMRAVKAPESRHVCFRFRKNAAMASLKEDTIPKVRKLCFPDLTLKWHEHRGGFFEFPNGAQIWISGLDDKDRVEKILGMEFATLFVNECSQVPFPSILMARTRVAQVCEMVDGRPLVQREYYDLNPVGKGHWVYQEFVNLLDPVEKRPVKDPENYRIMHLNPRDNQQNLDPSYLASLANLPARRRKRFFLGDWSDDIDGALWTIDIIARCRVRAEDVPPLQRIVVAVDPSGAKDATDDGHDAIGIMAVGLGNDGHAYVLKDHTLLGSPAQWGRASVAAYHEHQADRVVAEVNFGGAMVEFVIATADDKGLISVHMVTASRGKVVRAEPVSALYEKGFVHHVGEEFGDLEDEMEAMTTGGYTGQGSPNRLDAMVWAIYDLLGISDSAGANMIEYMRQVSAGQKAEDDALAAGPDALAGQPGWSGPASKAKATAEDAPDDLMRYYDRARESMQPKTPPCAGCGREVIGTRISDGVDVWHPNCRPR